MNDLLGFSQSQIFQDGEAKRVVYSKADFRFFQFDLLSLEIKLRLHYSIHNFRRMSKFAGRRLKNIEQHHCQRGGVHLPKTSNYQAFKRSSTRMNDCF
jgi:hypothetical protein